MSAVPGKNEEKYCKNLLHYQAEYSIIIRLCAKTENHTHPRIAPMVPRSGLAGEMIGVAV